MVVTAWVLTIIMASPQVLVVVMLVMLMEMEGLHCTKYQAKLTPIRNTMLVFGFGL